MLASEEIGSRFMILPSEEPREEDRRTLPARGDWNVVATIRENGYRKAVDFFRRLDLGTVGRTSFMNVLVMKVEDRTRFLETLRQRLAEDPGAHQLVARVVPAQETFNFQSVEEFRAKAVPVVEAWAPSLAGKSFHVRIRRRGFKATLDARAENERLAEAIFGVLARSGQSAAVQFKDPDAVVAVETVGNRAGLALWTREELTRYPFLLPD